MVSMAPMMDWHINMELENRMIVRYVKDNGRLKNLSWKLHEGMTQGMTPTVVSWQAAPDDIERDKRMDYLIATYTSSKSRYHKF